jgi:hypothetical protein
VSQAAPPIPTEAISGAKRDVEALKGHVPSRSGGATAGEPR